MSLSASNKHVETPVEVRGVEQDERLAHMLAMCKTAMDTFVGALPDMKERMSFKAFTIKAFEGEEAKEKMDSVCDLLQTGLVMAIQDQKELLEVYNFDVSIQAEEVETVLWLHARHKADEKHDDSVEPEEAEHSGCEANKDRDVIATPLI